MTEDIKPCPLCGRTVEFREHIQFVPPDQNMYSTKWFAKSEATIHCNECYLTMSVWCAEDFKSRTDGLKRHAEFIQEVIDRWNRRVKE